MPLLKIDISKTAGFFDEPEYKAVIEAAVRANVRLHGGGGLSGWVNLPSSFGIGEIAEINDVALSLRDKAEVVISIGIGGSYLGGRAIIEALGNSFGEPGSPEVLFAGHNLSEDYLWELLDAVKDKSLAVIVISKSGATLEPSVAFRILRAELEGRYGKKEAARRIVAVTDGSHGVLREIARKEGYVTLTIPADVGGRYSALTTCGLLPAAVAGVDISELIRGARDMEVGTEAGTEAEAEVGTEPGGNPAITYAAIRNVLYDRGFKIEIFAAYDPKLKYFGEWWKQLFAESEGKGGRGIFPATVNYTTDLHSMGQYIQDGERTLFETVVSVAPSDRKVFIPGMPDDDDGLNYLSGRRVSGIGKMAELGVADAHTDGGVPNIRIELPAMTPYHIGALLYFFEKACGISAYILGVDPFDQPGVEDYKRNISALLDKPGR